MGLFHLTNNAVFPLLHLVIDVAVDLDSQGIIKGYDPEKIDKQGDRQQIKRRFR